MNYTKLYPIGTVVRANKLNLMIISLVRKYQGELYDYIGVIYPQGYSDEEHMVLFNQNDITAVYHIGYINDQIRDYLNDIKKEIEEH